ncbi:hypothetical protein ACFL5X_01600 [Candidatus Omnitrophota bacterium]
MKTLLSILVALALCAPAFGATTLSDADMAGIYGKNVAINDVTLSESAAVVQSNIGIIGAGDECNGKDECMADVSGAMINNGNLGLAINLWGDAAAVLQSNIGVIAALGGATSCAFINNKNLGIALNVYPLGEEGPVYGEDPDGGNTIEASSLEAGESSINGTYASNSAVVAQSNIGVVFGQAGVRGAMINNCNVGAALNVPGPIVVAALKIVAAHYHD